MTRFKSMFADCCGHGNGKSIVARRWQCTKSSHLLALRSLALTFGGFKPLCFWPFNQNLTKFSGTHFVSLAASGTFCH